MSPSRGGGLTLAHFQAFFAKGYFLRSLSNTLILGVTVTLVMTALGCALAYLVTRGPRPLHLPLRAITVARLIVPPYLFGLALIISAGRRGFLAQLLGIQIPIYRWPRVVLAEILSFLPGTIMGIGYLLAFNQPPLLLTGTVAILVVNMIARFLAVGLEAGVSKLHQIDISIEEASADLGAGMLTTFRRIVLPLMSSAFVAGFLFTFMQSIISLSAAILLVAPGRLLASVYIFNWARDGDMGIACAISVILILTVAACLAGLSLLARRTGTSILAAQA